MKAATIGAVVAAFAAVQPAWAQDSMASPRKRVDAAQPVHEGGDRRHRSGQPSLTLKGPAAM